MWRNATFSNLQRRPSTYWTMGVIPYLYSRAWSLNLRAYFIYFTFRLCISFPQTLSSHSNSACLRLDLLCFCSNCTLALRYVAACTDFLFSSLKPCPRTKGPDTPGRFQPSMSVLSPYSDWYVQHRRVFSAVPTPSESGGCRQKAVGKRLSAK